MNDTGFVIPSRLYDFLKYMALVVLPALAALVLGLGVLLNWSGAVIFAGVVTLIDTFLGATLGKSASNFKSQPSNVFGDLIVSQEPDGSPSGIRIVGLVENPIFEENSQVVLNVKREQKLE